MKVKSIGYAYPTSPIAEAAGFRREGCHYIAVKEAGKSLEITDLVYVCSKLKDAVAMIDHAVDVTVPYCRYSMYKPEKKDETKHEPDTPKAG